MVVGLLMLLFIRFNRIWPFSYLRLDAMLCGFFKLTRLPVASTFWRYLKMIAELSAKAKPPAEKSEQRHEFGGIAANTVRIARLRLLMIATKMVTDLIKR